MGNQQSRKSSTTANVEIELNHSRIRFIKVINDSRQRYMQAIFSTQKNDYITWATTLMTKKLGSNHLLLPISYEFQSGEFCGTSGQAKVNYENYPYLLLQQIENRRHKKKRFDQTELWLLLYCLLQAQKQMKTYTENHQGIGDVRPQNIFLNQEGLMKVACGWSWPKESNNYQKFLENQVTYLAPQDLPLIQQQKVDNSQNKQSQTFSIALTILSAANLTSYNNLYSLSSKKFNTQEFLHVLNEWRLNEFYSDIFKSTLGSMLEIDLTKRVEQKVMFEWIERYRENILGRKDFVINDPPQAIINEVQVIKGLYESVMGSRYGGMSKLQGSRRLVVGESRQFVPSLVVPPLVQQQPFFIGESGYKPVDIKPTSHLSNYLLQGAPIVSNAPVNPNSQVLFNRTSVPTLYSQTKTLTESVYTKNYSSAQQQQQHQNGNTLLSMGKMNFQYNTFGNQPSNQQSPQRIQNQSSQRGTQTKLGNDQQQASNQPEIVENPPTHQAQPPQQ